jgi:hypothetical protein
VLVSRVYLVGCRLFAAVLLLARRGHSKELDLLVLRHKLSVMRRQARRPQLTQSDRLVLAAAASSLVSRRPSSRLRRSCAGTGRSLRAAGHTRAGGRPPADQEVGRPALSELTFELNLSLTNRFRTLNVARSSDGASASSLTADSVSFAAN